MSEPRARRVGVMGGSFNPIHIGHLVTADEARYSFGLDEVVFVPAGHPWQKEAGDVAPAEHRYMMCVIATSPDPTFRVSRIEIDRPGPTYTLDTLRALKDERPLDELFFITGADAILQILTWRDPEAVLRGRAPALVCDPTERVARIAAEGIDVLALQFRTIPHHLHRRRFVADQPHFVRSHPLPG